MRNVAVWCVLGVLFSCGGNEAIVDDGVDGQVDQEKQQFASAQATLMNFTFDGALYLPYSVTSSGAKSAIDSQLLYTIGHLNTHKSVGRLDKVTLSNIVTAKEGTGTRVTYKVVLPVSWGSKSNLPATYQFILPYKMGSADQDAFSSTYSGKCVDTGAHDVDASSYWYYYRPLRSGCVFIDADVARVTATAEVSTENTTGKYPEYHKVWEDNALRVVAIFGKYEDGATTASDAGIAAYNAFIKAVRAELKTLTLVTTPAVVTDAPGVGTPDITLEGTMADGKKVVITALLVDNVRTAGAQFDARYEALSTRADLIMYNGHAGLGANVRALANKGSWVAGQHAMFFMNGCDTYAYVDGSMAQTRARINLDDPTGTKYMEIITNGMPAYFASMSGASMALIRGLMKFTAPLTFEQMFKNVDSAQVVMVTGEEDNVYYPGYGQGGGTGGGAGGGSAATGYEKTETAFVDAKQELRFETPVISAGAVTVTLKHDAAHPGGDADLYVKVGEAPTATSYDCRPYKNGSDETCSLTLSADAKVFVSVIGYSNQQNWFTLTISAPRGTTPPPVTVWSGMNEQGTVTKNEEKRFATELLQPGKYVFDLSGTGDADLYVRAGSAPSTTEYDCRPYKGGTAEQCVINLSAPGPLHVMVRGYAASSSFTLVGKPQP